MNNEKHQKNHSGKKAINPSDIKGKIEVPDTRERKDGPGGN
ncbi:MAG: hypothetical protein ACI4A5_05195 [Hominilimicola sp.]